MRKRGSLEKGLVSSSPGGYWSEQPQHFAYPTKPPTKDGCFSRVPYSSLIAFVMCIIGVILFSLMMVWSFNATVEQTRRVLNITDIPWLDKVHIAFFITAFLMIVVAFALLSIGVLSTGSTREEVYKRASARQGGRLSCIVAISLSCFLHLLWIVLAALTAIFSFMYYVFSLLCASLPANSDSNCLDFSVFKPLIEDVSDSSLMLCSGNVQQFCALTNTVVVWYAVGFLSSVVVCLGLVQFVASAAANYAHIGNEARNAEINEILLAETRPMESFGNGNTRKYANGRTVMDFQVDAFPTYPGNGSAGTAPKYSTTPTLFAQPYYHQQSQSQFQPSSTILPYHNSPAANYGYSQDPLPNHHQGYHHGGSRSQRASGNAVLAASGSVGNVAGDAPMPTFTATRQNSVGGAVNAARRNSYHNSMKDGDYNNEFLHIY